MGSTPIAGSKRCRKCDTIKPIDAFSRKRRGDDERVNHCKVCVKEYQRGHYKGDPAQYVRRNRRRVEKLRAFVEELKSEPCADCGKRYPPCVMDFDHRVGSKKIGQVAEMYRNVSLQVLLAEIAKCDLVCANCHRIRTWKRRQ